MTHYLIITCCLLHEVMANIRVNGISGTSVVIRCPYDEGYEGYPKYLCRGACPAMGTKDIPVKSESGQTKAINGRFCLHDDITARVFTVTITELTEGDAGQYWCAVKTGFGQPDKYTEVELKVLKALRTSTAMAQEPISNRRSVFHHMTSMYTANHTDSTITTVQPTRSEQIPAGAGVYLAVGLGCLVLIVASLCLYVKFRHGGTPSNHVCSQLKSPSLCRTRTYVTVVGDHEATWSDRVYYNIGYASKQQDPVYQNISPISKTSA